MDQNKCCKIIPINLGMVNAYLLKGTDDKSIVIDCGIPGSEKAILKKMSESGIENRNLQLIIITHGHSDHMGASSALREITGAKTIIHKLDAAVIKSGKNPKLYPTNIKGKLLGNFLVDTIKSFIPYEPEIVIENEMSLYEFGIPGKIIETPGHTNGSISVLMDDGNIFVGDLIMGGMIGKGKPTFPMYAESIEKTNNSIRTVLSLAPKIIYTGHGGPFTNNEIKDNIQI